MNEVRLMIKLGTESGELPKDAKASDLALEPDDRAMGSQW
jgi:hypothetical protein